MNIYAKIQNVIVQLQKKEIKKSGKNHFAKFEYFELSDFLPTLNELLQQNNLYCQFNFYAERACLTIHDTEAKDSASFECPVADLELKGCHPVQNLGGVQTYLRRYLLINAFAISESDMADASDLTYTATADNKKIDKKQLDTIMQLAQNKNKNDVVSVLRDFGYKKSTDIKKQDFNAVCASIKKIDVQKSNFNAVLEEFVKNDYTNNSNNNIIND